MTSIETAIIRDAKQHINAADIEGLRAFYQDTLATEFPAPVDWAYVLQKVYLHACLKRQHAAAAWLEQLFWMNVDPINQAAYRQMFPYGRYLLNRRRT